MRFTKLLCSLVGVFTFFACSNSDDTPETIAGVPEGTNLRVNFFRQLCFGEGRFQCLQVQEGDQLGTNDWSNFFGAINGFEYEGGFIYNLEVRTRTIELPPADGSSFAYDLVLIISREAFACTFENPVQDLEWLQTEISFREANPNEELQYCYITQASIDGNPVFVYRDCNPFIDKIDPVFNCFGVFLGFVGDEGVEFSALADEKLVWSPNTFSCILNL